MNIAVLKKYMPLLKELVNRDVKIKYRRSFLGMLWTILNPLGMMIILTIVFSSVFRQDIENFPVYLMCGQLIFNFFNESTSMCMTAIIGNSGLISKVYVPKYFFPVSRVCSCFVNLLTSCIALFIVIVVTRTPISWTVVLAVFPIMYILLLSIGMGMLLSAVTVSFRDMIHLYGVLLTAWMYLTPIFYPITMIPEGIVRDIIQMNPITCIIQMLRNVVLYGNVPTLTEHLQCALPCVIMIAIGTIVFKKLQDNFILKL